MASGGILVHCFAGVSRSATITIAFMMTEKQLPFYDAMSFVRKRRHIIFPNIGF
jgi:protein-tyrosine phosphatase